MMTLLAAAAPIQSPTPARLDWPTPHHFKMVEEPALDGPEHGMVAMNDGRKLVGNVVRLDTSALVLEFQPDLDQEALHALEFVSDLKIDPVLASLEDLLFAIEQFYGPKEGQGNILELVAEVARRWRSQYGSREGSIKLLKAICTNELSA